MAGFTFRYRLAGDAPTIQSLLFGTGTTKLSKGDLVNLGSGGTIGLGATGNTNFVGVVLNTVTTDNSGTAVCDVITDFDAVYGVVDANARVKGATLDIAGTTGAQGVAASSNKEFVVQAACGAGEETLVRFNVGKHVDNKAQ